METQAEITPRTAEEKAQDRARMARAASGSNNSGPRPLVQPPSILAAMRRVFGRPKEQDCYERDKKLRRMYEKDPDRFLMRLAALEQAHESRKDKQLSKATKTGQSKAQPEKQDDGEEKLIELMNKLMKEAKDGTQGEGPEGTG